MNTEEVNRYLDDTFEWAPPDCEDKAERCILEIKKLLQCGEINQKIIDKMRKEKFDVWISLLGSFTNLPDFVSDIEEEVMK